MNYKLVLTWAAVVCALLILLRRSGREFNAKTVGITILTATCCVAFLMWLPPFKPSGIIENWLRNFILFTALIHFALQSTRKQSALSGISFATILAFLELLA